MTERIDDLRGTLLLIAELVGALDKSDHSALTDSALDEAYCTRLALLRLLPHVIVPPPRRIG